MNFSAWAIRNPIAPILAFALLTIVGIQSFPDIADHPVPQYRRAAGGHHPLAQSGAAPSEMEAQITKGDRGRRVAGITGVDDISLDRVRRHLHHHRHLPDGSAYRPGGPGRSRTPSTGVRGDSAGPRWKSRSSPASMSKARRFMTFAVNAPDMTLEEASWFVDDTIKRALQGQPGVGKVLIATAAPTGKSALNSIRRGSIPTASRQPM